MKPAAPALRKTRLMLCSAAAFIVLSGNADAQNAAGSADDDCPLATPYTIACVQRSMITNDQLREAVSYSSLTNHFEKVLSEQPASDSAPDSEAYRGAKKRLDGILQYAADQSAEMAIARPDLYVGMLPTQALQTREGKPFVLVNKNAFKLAMLTDAGAAQLKLSFSREFAHIRNGHTSPSAIAQHHNDAASSREAELRADLEGAGPLGAKDPIAVTAYIEDNLRDELQKLVFFKGSRLNDVDPNRLSDRDYRAISDEHEARYGNPFHLSPWDRIVALHRESRLMSEYERTHTVRTHSEREAESKWLVDQILRDTRCTIHQEPAADDSAPCFQAPAAR